jgi:DNA polymerase-3 subunit delta
MTLNSMRPAEFISAVRQGKLHPVYLWAGADRILHEECRNAVANSLPPEAREWCLAMIEFQPGLLSRQLEGAQQMPMLGARSFFLFSDPEDFRHASDEDTEALEGYLKKPSPFSAVIFAAIEPDRRRRFIQLLEKKAEKVELEPQSKRDAAEWASEYCRAAGMELDRGLAEALAEKFVVSGAGRGAQRETVNLLWLRTELDKLMTAKAGAKRIESEDLELVAAVREEHEMGKMLRALAERRCEEALTRMRALLSSKVAETLLLWSVGDLIRQALKGASRSQGSRPAWAARSNPFSTWEIAPLARRSYSRGELLRALQLVRQADLAIKSSWKDSRLLLEMLIWQIASGKACLESEGALTEDSVPSG